MKKFFLTALSIIALSSCESTFVDDPDDISYLSSHATTLEKQFEYFWHGINNSYVFWDFETTDWDEVYDQYLPIFKELDQKGKRDGTLPNKEVQNVIDSLGSMFIDGHMIIGFTNPYNDWNELSYNVGWNNLQKRTGLTEFSILKDELVNSLSTLLYIYNPERQCLQTESCVIKKGNDNYTSINTEIEKGIIYLRVPICNFSRYDEPDFLSYFDRFSNRIRYLSQSDQLKGIILDFRGNSGGFESDIDFWLQLFIEEPSIALYNRAKNGLGKYDYGDWKAKIVQPDPERQICPSKTPTVILINNLSASGGEICPSVLRTLPNSHTIGLPTFGATGSVSSLLSTAIFHAGSFNYFKDYYPDIDNGIGAYARMSFSATKLFNSHSQTYECLEGVGVTPDEIVNNEGDDNQLQAAVDYIKRLQ